MGDKHCNPECTPELLSNYVCDVACNNFECFYDNYYCLCAPGCFPELRNNGKCNSSCDTKTCSYDDGDCTSESAYINLLTVIGFVVIALSFCLIFIVMIWYYRRRRYENLYRIAGSEESARQNIIDINNKIPEYPCPEVIIGETCVVCIDEFRDGQMIRKLVCDHSFHSDCIVQWLINGRTNSCPLCNTSPFK